MDTTIRHLYGAKLIFLGEKHALRSSQYNKNIHLEK